MINEWILRTRSLFWCTNIRRKQANQNSLSRRELKSLWQTYDVDIVFYNLNSFRPPHDNIYWPLQESNK